MARPVNVGVKQALLATHALEAAGIEPTEAKLKELFKVSVDKNKDGFLSASELATAVKKLMGSVPPGAARANTPIERVLTAVPPALASNYSFSLSGDRKTLTINPPLFRMMTTRGPMAKGMGGYDADVTDRGGRAIKLDSGAFDKGGWIKGKLKDVVSDKTLRAKLETQARNAGVPLDLNKSIDLLVVKGEKSDAPTIFAFSGDPTQRALIGLCSDVQVMAFGPDAGGGGGHITFKKPVIYVYPTQKTNVTVSVDVVGGITVQYPKMRDGKWSMVATPDGTLFDTVSEKRYSYLFWEGNGGRGLSIDEKQAHCIASADVEEFLDRAATQHGLNDRERTDFVSFWLPAMQANKHNLVQFLSEDVYAKRAKLTVSPKPDSEIRLFMLFKGSDTPVTTGNPALPRYARKGFTVVEWGGANLDE